MGTVGQFPDESKYQSAESPHKNGVRSIGFACCLSAPGACGGLWTGRMLLVCSTYVYIMCIYYFVRFADEAGSRRNARVSQHERKSVTLQQNNECYTDDLNLLR